MCDLTIIVLLTKMATNPETPTVESDEDSDDERRYKRRLLNAVEANDFEGVKKLMSSHKFLASTYVDIRDSTDKNNTLLHIAIRTRKRKVQTDNTKIIELLMQNGANIEAKNDLGETPFHLLEKRTKTNSRNEDWKQVIDMFSVTNSSNHLANHQETTSIVRVGAEARTSNIPSTSTHLTSNEKPMETEEKFCFDGNPTHEASGLKTSLHGVIYQLQLLMLFLHRSIRLYDCVYLATELNQAVKFDDVVLRYKVSKDDKLWTWKFLQAKHLLHANKDRIRKGELFSKAEKQGEKFALHKYFDSFCQIKDHPYFKGDIVEEFIICTNTDFDQSAKNFFIEDKHFKNDKLLFFEHQNMQKYKLRSVAKEELRNLYKLIAKKACKEKHLEEFLEKFRFIVNYPNRFQINRLITRELGEYIGLLNSDLATNSFKNDVLNWFMSYKNKQSEFLLIKDGKHFLNSIKHQMRLLITSGLSLAYPEKLADYNLEFADISKVIQGFLNDNRLQILDITSESPLLSCIKINQYLKQINLFKIKDSCIFVELRSLCFKNVRDLVYDSYSARSSYNLLLINCDHKTKRNSLNSIYSKLLGIICENGQKKVILIGKSDNKLSKKLLESNSGVSYTKLNDTNGFANLTPFVQSKILSKSVFLQGRRVMLEDILDINSANKLISNALLVKLIREEEIRIDEFGIEHPVLHYKTRTLSHQLIKARVLEDEQFLRTNIVLITGADYQTLTLRYSIQYIDVWTEGKNVKNGVILLYDASLCAITIFEEIHKYNPQRNIYWLEYKEGRLIWKQFFGEANALRHFIDTDCDMVEEEQITMADFLENKINIVSAGPGSGKSSLMSNLGQRMKTKYPNWWTKRVNLNDYVSSKDHSSGIKNAAFLDDINFSEDDTNAAIVFLSNMLFAMHNSKEELYFEKSLFEMSFQRFPSKSKLIKLTLIFDGFDEISPSYKQQTLLLLKALRNSNVAQMWVTTRSHEEHSLEDSLNVPALHLNPFTNKQKFEYIQHFINENANHITPISLNDMYNRICYCLEDISLSSDNRPNILRRVPLIWEPSPSPEELLGHALEAEFTNVPLHLNMLAEVAFSPEGLQTQVLSIPHLYKTFTNKKFSIYYGEKALTSTKVQAAKEMRQRDLNIILDIHASIAFGRMFPHLVDEILDFDEAELARIGFLSVNAGRLQFVHWSFAEYFVVYYLRKHISKEPVQRILWESILSDDHYRLVRSFINENENFLMDISRRCTEKILQMQRKDDFFVFLKEKHSNIIKFFFTLIRRNKTEKLYEMEFDLKGDYIAGFNVAVETDRKFLILLRSLKYDEYFFSEMCPSIMSTYEHKSYYVRSTNPLYILMRHYTGPDITKVIHYIYTKEVQDNFCNLILHPCSVTGESLLHVLAERGKFDYMKQLITWISTHIPQFLSSGFLLTVDEVYHRTFLYVVNYNVTFDDCLSYLLEIFGVAEMIKLCKSFDYNGRTIIHYIIMEKKENNFMKLLLEMFKKHFDSNTIKDILLRSDNYQKTAFHYNSAQCETFTVLFHFLISYFTPDIFNQLLLLVDNESKTILHYIMGNSDDLEHFFNYLKANFNNLRGIRNILLHLDQKGRSALHLAVEKANSSKGILALFSFVYNMFDYPTVKELLFAEDVDGQTALHRSCNNLNGVIMAKDIINYSAKYLNVDDFNIFIRKRDFYGRNVLHHASSSFECTTIIAVLSSLKDHYETNLIKDIITEQDDNGGTILHNAVGRNVANIKFILQYLRNDNCELEVFKQLLLKKNNQSQTVLNLILKTSKNDDTAFDILGSSYNWFIFKLHAECEQKKNQPIIYWSEFDELSVYIGYCSRWIRDTDLKQKLNNIYDYLYNHSSWTPVGDNEWVLKM